VPLEEPQVGDVDIVHAHSQNSLFSVRMAEKLKKKTNGKVAIYFMAVDAFRDYPNKFIRLFGSYYEKRSTKTALKIADLRLVRSMRDKEGLNKKFKLDATYLPDGIPDYYFTVRKGDPKKFREKYGIKQEKIFLFIGRMHKLKGILILVKALKYVNKDVATVFIGPDGGCLRETLNLAEKIGVRDNVYTLGYLDEETKIHALDSAVALVLPSIANYVEVYPMVISEAWAREKPVIASSVGGIPYRVKNYVNGLLVDAMNPKSLAEAMSILLKDVSLREKLGSNGRSEVVGWSEIARKSIELYEEVF
jgi:glycosyltransferase involved in cell wall biosynthesis